MEKSLAARNGESDGDPERVMLLVMLPVVMVPVILAALMLRMLD